MGSQYNSLIGAPNFIDKDIKPSLNPFLTPQWDPSCRP